ncbi:MAG: thioredoxin fold domain-containing protein [Kiritimatiellaceae bacterium]|nr:thioredoxin fold domain-containing protein [Kiritimatiellaceae bacterium]
MKKLILFSLLLAAVLTATAQSPVQKPAETSWQDVVKQFTVVRTGTGYMDVGDFTEFLDRAEGMRKKPGIFKRFTARPVTFYENWGLWPTLLLILFGGLALNLTPCVLPMIPVNLAIIGAGAQSESRRKGFALGSAYGLGITVVYGLLGLAVVLGGARFGALNASPWFNLIIAVIFLLLALAMFNVFHIDLAKLHQHLSRRQVEEEYLAAFGIGGLSALLAGACVAPVVIAVLLLSGNLYTNGVHAGLALPFVLGLGMALPWPFAGAGLSFLPRPGAWMEWVKRGFGVLILLLAGYYGQLGGRLLIAHMKPSGGEEHLVVCENKSTCFKDVLSEALAANQPVFIDFWADWCKNCRAMDKTTFADPKIKSRMERYKVIKFDASNYDESPAKEILDHFGVLGLPTYVVLNPVK